MKTEMCAGGAEHELRFWQWFVTTERFLNGWVAPIQTPELQPAIADLIRSMPDAAVLDVGSGVVSILTGLVPTGNLTAADPLAYEFRKFFDYIAADVRMPEPIAAEDIDFDRQFEIVHIRNAFDHTANPAAAYAALWAAVAPGGILIIHGFANEATFENRQGFHQWNVDIIDNRLCVSGNRDGAERWELFDSGPPEIATKETLPENGREWITWVERKPV